MLPLYEIGIILALQVLPDDSGNDSDGNTAFFIQACYNKGNIVLFSGHPVIQTGVGNCVDAVGKPNKNHALVDVGHFSRIFALDPAFLQIFLGGIRCQTLYIDANTDFFRCNTQ